MAGLDGPAMERIAGDEPDPFRVLVACILSLRTRDPVTEAASVRLFVLADTPTALLALPDAVLEEAIYPCAFYRTKTRGLKALCEQLQKRFGGRVPARQKALLSLPGVGLKTANLVLSVGFGQAAICVDTHVHRISNRLGLIETATPEETEAALRSVVPRTWWGRVNRLMVRYGQEVCVPVSPRCSQCTLRGECPQKGVGRHR